MNQLLGLALAAALLPPSLFGVAGSTTAPTQEDTSRYQQTVSSLTEQPETALPAELSASMSSNTERSSVENKVQPAAPIQPIAPKPPVSVLSDNRVPSVETAAHPIAPTPPIKQWDANQFVEDLVDTLANTFPPKPPVPTPDTGGAFGTNLVPNGNLEKVGSNGYPVGWGKGGWGDNARTYAYPVTMTNNGSKAAQVTMKNRVTGDVKWFPTLSLEPGTYSYRDEYTSSVPSVLTLQLKNADGSYSYRDLATLPARQRLAVASVVFSVPPGTIGASVFHLIQQNGTLTIDNVSVRKMQPRGIFKTGGVSLRFDDGWRSQYDIVLPKLQAAGMKGTFYITTEQIADNGFSGFMSKDQIRQLAARGHEIGAHTRTHPHLASLSVAQQRQEIVGSRQDLLSWKIWPVATFSYPFGEYTAETLRIVKDAGFSNAVASAGGTVTVSADPFQLKRRGIETGTSLAQVKQWIDEALANDEWLILEFHQVSNSCPDKYCTSPAIFNGIVDHLAAKKAAVVTVSDGAEALRR